MKDKILLVIPFYNCERQITRVLGKITPNILQYIQEIILINNCSLDNGEKVAVEYCRQHKYLPAKILRNEKNYGLGGSHKVGFKYAIDNGFDYVIVLHGDDQGDIQNFESVLRERQYDGYDLILGSRFMKESVLSGYSRIRTWGNKFFIFIFHIIVKTPRELGSGLNMYRVDMLKNYYYEHFRDDLYFEVDMIMATTYLKQRVLSVPITWSESDQVSNNKLIKCAWALFKMLISWLKSPAKFVEGEHRKMIIDNYSYLIVYSNREVRE